MGFTAQQIIGLAFGELNVFMAGESVTPSIANDALVRLNLMINRWRIESFTIPVVVRDVFASPVIVAGKGGPSNPYTIGIGGNLNIPRPPSQAHIRGTGLLQTTTSPQVEISRGLMTDDAYRGISVKELQSAMWTNVYYNPTYAGDLGTINLWPVPNITTNSLVLYTLRPLTQFADLTTEYDFPDGSVEAIFSNLAIRLGPPNGRAVSDDTRNLAGTSLMTYKRSNVKMFDLSNDFARDRGGVYDIIAGGSHGGVQ